MAVTAMLGPVLAVVCQVAPARAALAPFADPIIFLFIGSFMLAEAMFVHGLDRRIAFTALASRWVGTSGARILVVYGLVGTVDLDVDEQHRDDRDDVPDRRVDRRAVAAGHDGAGRGAAQVRDGDDADHVVRRVDRRHGDAGGHAAQPDRHRPHRAHHRHAHRLLPLDGHRRAAGADPLRVPGGVLRVDEHAGRAGGRGERAHRARGTGPARADVQGAAQRLRRVRRDRAAVDVPGRPRASPGSRTRRSPGPT